MLSLDAPLDRDSGLTVADGIADDDGARAGAPAARQRASRLGRRDGSPSSTRASGCVIERRYGLNGCEVTTLEELPPRSASRASACGRSRARRSTSCAQLERRGAAGASDARTTLLVSAPTRSAAVRYVVARSVAGAGSTSIARSSVATSASRSPLERRRRRSAASANDSPIAANAIANCGQRAAARCAKASGPSCGMPRQPGAREPAIQVVPQHERALLLAPLHGEPARARARPRPTAPARCTPTICHGANGRASSRATASAGARG